MQEPTPEQLARDLRRLIDEVTVIKLKLGLLLEALARGQTPTDAAGVVLSLDRAHQKVLQGVLAMEHGATIEEALVEAVLA